MANAPSDTSGTAEAKDREAEPLTLFEVFAKAVEAFYVTEERFLATPNEQTLTGYLEAQEHHHVLREHLRAVSLVRRATEASQLAEFTEQLLQRLDARDAKEAGDA